MNFAQVLSAYLNLNLLVLVGFSGLTIFSWIIRSRFISADKNLSAVTELKLHYAVLVLVMCLAVGHVLLPKNEIFTTGAKVWSAPSMSSFTAASPVAGGYLSIPSPIGTSAVKTEQISMFWLISMLLILGAGFLNMGRDLAKLFRTQRRSFLIRQIGRVKISVCQDVQVPFSYWLPGQAHVVLPSALLENHKDYKISVAHELQHHRHGDTRWVYIMWGLKLVCILNPAIYFWNRWIMEIQEFACDETLVDQGKVESQNYARCLVEVAQHAVNQKTIPVCATGLTLLIERNLLKRRITKMLQTTTQKTGRSVSLTACAAIALVMGVTAFASKGLVQDRRVSLSQAQAMAAKAQSETDFPVVVNDLVLKQLNRYIGTPEGREFMRNALRRMEDHKTTINEHLLKYNAPSEILAIPIIESGYRNLPEGEVSSVKAAGLWQFIASTARNYGLQVNSVRDERTDVPLSTDAAIRYLQSNYLRFKDWHLSALAYNMGESAVGKGIAATGSRNAWTLIRNGYEGDKDYLAKLMTAIIIMRNPDSVE